MDFEQARPRIIGCLLDAVSCGLKNLGSVKIDNLPRMADFARFIVAAEPALPWTEGDFMTAYRANQEESVTDVLESDPVAMTLRRFIVRRGTWEGTATELLEALNGFVDETVRRSRQWPRSPNYLSGNVKWVAPALRQDGITVDNVRLKGSKIWRFNSGAATNDDDGDA